ncbi:MAG: phage portal protein [Pseudomonadota bacterium]
MSIHTTKQIQIGGSQPLSVLDRLGNALDRAIGIFSPVAQGKRTVMRDKVRQYAAAKSNRLTGDWFPTGQNVNDILATSIVPVRHRVRQLVRDFPYFRRALNNLVVFTVGSGIVPQCRIKTADETKFDKKKVQLVEDEFSFWCDEADIAGKLHYYEMMELAKRQDVECGEYILVKTYTKEKGRRLPFALQMFESEWLTDLNAVPESKDYDIKMGIEYHKQTGRVNAYHFTDPLGWGKTKRIPAELVIHDFKTERPGQLRGISPFVAAVIVANDLSAYMDAEMDAAKLAAKYLAMVETPDPFSFQSGRVDADGKSQQKIESLENAIIEYLRPGEKITLASHNRPGDSFSPFVNLVLHMVAISTDQPYELLSGNYEGISYSNLKGIRNDFAQHLKPHTARHIRNFGMKTYRPWMESAVMKGLLPFKDYFLYPYFYLASAWQLPGMESIDPLRETKAYGDQISMLLRSPQEIVAARGRDFSDVLDEIEEAKKMAEEKGLTLGSISTAMQNNPAALGANDNEQATDKKGKVLTFQK